MKSNKTLYQLLILAAFVLVNALLIFGISQVLAYLNSGANRSSIFNKSVPIENYYSPKTRWISINNPGRPMEKETQKRIEKDYLNSWYARYEALRNYSSMGINDTYTSKAKVNLLSIVNTNSQNKISIDGTSLSHNLTLDFYSADGKLVVLTDASVNTYERVLKNGVLLYEDNQNSTFKVIMLLEDGFWRIRHLEKIETLEQQQPSLGEINDALSIQGINYYPLQNPWDTFGTNFSTKQLETDFQIIGDLGLNTIRIFISYEDFGKGHVLYEKLNKLTRLLDTAHSHNLEVIITLFDFYGDYSVRDWTLSQSHAISITNHVKNHPALLAWDIKNEPNLDFDARGSDLVLAWLSFMIKTVKKEDPNHPITIGWSDPVAALQLIDQVDHVSFHFYQDVEKLPNAIEILRNKTSKPIVLQEFGLSSNAGFWSPFGATESNQSDYYAAFFKQQKRGSINYLSWTLYDFSMVPSQVVGDYPWRKNKQSHFGLINKNGGQKKAYSIFINK